MKLLKRTIIFLLKITITAVLDFHQKKTVKNPQKGLWNIDYKQQEKELTAFELVILYGMKIGMDWWM
jgi:hypothetical protein